MRRDREMGITYRQLDFWTKMKYLIPEVSADGFTKRYSEEEKAIARLMGVLVRCGFRPGAAAIVARNAIAEGSNSIDLGEGVDIRFAEPAA